MSGAVLFPPFDSADWAANVVHRNAPGAMSAMALTVIPVSVRLRFISGAAAVSDTEVPLAVCGRGDERRAALGEAPYGTAVSS
jgi:hypothetical protein